MTTALIQKIKEELCILKVQLNLQPKQVELWSWEEQQKFLDATVNSERVKKYPVNSDFARLFFKKLLRYLEQRQEVHDDIYSYLCSLMAKDREKESFYYRHYIIGEDLKNCIIIKETKNMVVNGTTGMRTWEVNIGIIAIVSAAGQMLVTWASDSLYWQYMDAAEMVYQHAFIHFL